MTENSNISIPKKFGHLVNVAKAVFASLPFSGGIASLMSDYIPNTKTYRIELFMQDLAEDLKNQQTFIDEKVFHTDEFAYIFESCLRGAAEHYQEEKLKAFKSIIVNSAISSNINEEEKEYFLNLVLNLSVIHIRILKFMSMPMNYLSEMNVPIGDIQGGFSDFFPKAIPTASIDVIKSSYEELFRYGLINTDKSIFTTMTSASGLGLLEGRVTLLGKDFISFITIGSE